MSNGDDVLDSWEEIEEADLTKSFQKIESSSQYSQLASSSSKNSTPAEFRPMKLLQRQPVHDGYSDAVVTVGSRETVAAGSTADMSALDTMTETFKPVLMMLHKPEDEYQSANYTTPISNQTVKILRRPAQSNDAGRNNGMSRPKQPIKSLQQREQEYAEARLRILGAAKNPDDDVNDTNSEVTKSTSKSSSSEVNSSTNVKNNQDFAVDKTRLVDASNDGGLLQQTREDFFYPSAAAFQKRPLPDFAVDKTRLFDGDNASGYYRQLPPQNEDFFFPSAAAFQTRPMQNMPNMSMEPQNAYQAHAMYAQAFHQVSPQAMVNKQWPTAASLNHHQQQGAGLRQGHNNNNNHKQTSPQNESVLRLPRGPDGSIGFQIRR